jgi:hypothetical protein
MSSPTPVALPEPKEGYEDYGLNLTREDVRRINLAMQNRLATLGNLRVQVAFFRVVTPITPPQYERKRKAAIKRWLSYMERTGWQLASEVKDYPEKARTSTAMTGDWYSVPVLDEVEIPVAAAFRKLDMKIVRTEVPVQD